ncbi:alpha/beta fold hydrolase [Paenibacillus psychroresistens]|uniref:Alpha/beta fold hydrolase n=1 Tax=Paenibacillus psychroresistens TaxID=1778678 RepID=A0A6B8RTW5_9BACL|nr:alpha/beta hydrolase [Paenibacillus psychroresistens]QGQ99254.1 alpha/beta fold hydrolase [Paenibacillus psychroresistens]
MPRVRVNGIDLNYEERGSGTPLILLMGLGADGSVWEEHVKAYEQHFRCVLIDNRGAGQSDKPLAPYSTRLMAEDTAGLMDALGIYSAHVAGISMGGAIAQELALLYPERILSLTLNCTWSHCNAYMKAVFSMLSDMYAMAKPDAFAKLLNLWIFTPQYHDENGEDLHNREAEALETMGRMPAHAFSAQCGACAEHDTRGRLADLKLPVFVTVGEKDIFTPPEHSLAIAAELTHAELTVFEGSGHTHHWDKLAKFNQLTLAFMLSNENGSN